ncbi:extracellular solute-binding protein [Pseudonocardia xinjiangensis]|uniref:extracellular solute-binding protein n=1 Tax=Pseudonocardia xinjiangensis TaxID=75289 RepID=UPI003D8B8409
MSPRFRRTASVLAALSLAIVPSAACASGGPADDGALTIFIPQLAGADLAQSQVTKHIQEKFGISLRIEASTYDAAAAKEKRQISLASGDLPDVYMLIPWVDQFSQPELLQLGRQGIAVPLNDLIAQHAPNVQRAFEETPELRDLATAPDGTIYGMPQWNECYHCSYGAKLWINSDWLEKLGLAMPTTTEEMREVLRAFKTRDPNGNGRADEIPLSGSTSDTLLPYFMNAFLYDPQAGNAHTSTLAMRGGRVQLQAAQPEWRDGLRYVASLYEEGLIDPGAFSQNRDAMSAKGDLADAVVVGAATVQHPILLVTEGQPDGRDKQYDPVPPLTGPTGVQYASYNLPTVPGATFVITAEASEADRVAAMRILDYFHTQEGNLMGQFGPEGTDWLRPGPGDVAIDPGLEPIFEVVPTDPEAPRSVDGPWGAAAGYYSTEEFRNAQVQSTDIYSPEGGERRLYEATKLYDGKAPQDQIFPYWDLWVEPDQAGEFATLQTNIENHVAQSSLQFVTGQQDIDDDAAWNAYLDGLRRLGLDRYLEIQQAGYDGGR